LAPFPKRLGGGFNKIKYQAGFFGNWNKTPLTLKKYSKSLK
jgi:hypothetical protein